MRDDKRAALKTRAYLQERCYCVVYRYEDHFIRRQIVIMLVCHTLDLVVAVKGDMWFHCMIVTMYSV